jgi:hypothetical protein
MSTFVVKFIDANYLEIESSKVDRENTWFNEASMCSMDLDKFRQEFFALLQP